MKLTKFEKFVIGIMITIVTVWVTAFGVTTYLVIKYLGMVTKWW